MNRINSNTSRYQIERILCHRLHKGYYNYIEYFVKWKNHGENKNSWEHEDDLDEEEYDGTIEEYWRKQTKYGTRESALEAGDCGTEMEYESHPLQKEDYNEILIISSDDDDDGIGFLKKKEKEKPAERQENIKEEEKDRIPLKFERHIFEYPVTIIEISDDDDNEKEEKREKVEKEEEQMELEMENDDGIIDNPDYRSYFDDWEERINIILTVEKHVKYNIFKCTLEWNDGKCCVYPLKTIKEKCPRKLIDYYESILVIK